jgi:hypothetical protein
MNQYQKPPQRNKTAACRSAFAWLDAAMAENLTLDNTELIRQMRSACFADVDALQKSGQLILPKL